MMIAHAAVVSEKRAVANRRNALLSTGPRTVAGKARAARNAVSHGLCCEDPCITPAERGTYRLFCRELRESLVPKTAMQMDLFDQICSLAWRLKRVGDIERKLYEQLRQNEDEPICAVMARCFLAGANPFEAVSKMEHRLRGQYLRLLKRYDTEKKTRAADQYVDHGGGGEGENSNDECRNSNGAEKGSSNDECRNSDDDGGSSNDEILVADKGSRAVAESAERSQCGVGVVGSGVAGGAFGDGKVWNEAIGDSFDTAGAGRSDASL